MKNYILLHLQTWTCYSTKSLLHSFKNSFAVKFITVSLILLFSTIYVDASPMNDLRWGFAGGFGGTGLKTTATLNGTATAVERSEGPLIGSIYLDWIFSDKLTFALEDTQGIRLGPFSAGVTFFGITGRYYYQGAAPALEIPKPDESALLIRGMVPFFGYSMGFAFANITRSGDQVASITDSGAYYGIRAGFDYPLAYGRAWRGEVSYNTTFSSGSNPPVILSEFAITAGFLFHL